MTLVSAGEFSFPDDVFPAVPAPFPGLPLAPQEKVAKILGDYDQYVNKAMAGISQDSTDEVHKLFKWARETMDFAETQPGVPTHVINTAMDIVRVVSSLEGSKFKGAALYMMGLWYLFGLFGVRTSSSKARELFMSSAKLGYSRSLYRIGSDYETRGDVNTALVYFDHGVKRGDAACYYRMAMSLLRGHLNKEVDVAQGLKFLEKSSLISDPDCPQSAYMYGLIQLGELPYVVSPDPQPEAGILALERSAWLGFAPAQIRMGKAWQGGEKGYDAAVALRYFHLASRQLQYARFKGDDQPAGSDVEAGAAEAEISKWFLCGSDGVFSPNEEWAYKFASLAAEFSNPIAEFAVGYFYEVGIYVECDMNTAIEWYRMSAAHKCADAEARLAELEGHNGGVEVERKLTRKDHERTMSVKGRGSIRSSRKDRDGDVRPEMERLQSAPSAVDTVAEEPEVDEPRFEFESSQSTTTSTAHQLPSVEASPFTFDLGPSPNLSPINPRFASTTTAGTSPQLNPQQSPQLAPQQQSPYIGASSPTISNFHEPLNISKKPYSNGVRTTPQPVEAQQPLSTRTFSVQLSDPPTAQFANMNVNEPMTSPSSFSSHSGASQQHQYPASASVTSAEYDQYHHDPQQPQHQGYSLNEPSSHSRGNSWEDNENNYTSNNTDMRQAPQLRQPSGSYLGSSSPTHSRPYSSGQVISQRPSSTNNNGYNTPPLQAPPNAQGSIYHGSRPSSGFVPPAPRSPLSQAPSNYGNFDLHPPPSPHGNRRSASPNSHPHRPSASPSMLSLNSPSTPQPPATQPPNNKSKLAPSVTSVSAGPAPLTFEEMGVKTTTGKDKDCVIM